MMKKLLGIVAVIALVVSLSATALAGTSTYSLEYKGVKADSKLVADFNWAILASDTATATTNFVTDNGGYRVAVRLECWTGKDTMSGYKYNSDSQLAQCNYTWTDVYAFQSRHSIDNSSNTTEYAVYAHTQKE